MILYFDSKFLLQKKASKLKNNNFVIFFYAIAKFSNRSREIFDAKYNFVFLKNVKIFLIHDHKFKRSSLLNNKVNILSSSIDKTNYYLDKKIITNKVNFIENMQIKNVDKLCFNKIKKDVNKI